MASAGWWVPYSIFTWERRGLSAAPWWVVFGCYAARWLDKVSRGGGVSMAGLFALLYKLSKLPAHRLRWL